MSKQLSAVRTLSSLLFALPALALPAAIGIPAAAQRAHAQQSHAQHAQTAQQVQTPSSSAHATVLPITVRDKKGAFVESLQKSDITLTQDNRPQTIASLTKSSDQPLRIGLLVDTSHTVRGALEAERKAADSFVDTVLPSGTRNQAFLIHFDRQVELLEDFTSSRDKLHREIDDMGATRQEKYEGQGPETTGDDRGGTTRHNGKQLYDAIFLASDELMKNKEGRKVLVLFSDGADQGSKDTLNDAIDAADRAGVSIYTIFTRGAQERESGFQNPTDDRRGGSWPGGGGGYPGGGGGYPGGNRRQPEPRAGNGIDGKKIMHEIATRTGGHAFEAKKREDLIAIHGLIDQELKSQYLLAYTPDKPDTDGSFHKIAVTTTNKDWTISAPEGYYAPEK